LRPYNAPARMVRNKKKRQGREHTLALSLDDSSTG
jgi:hypothetical protein